MVARLFQLRLTLLAAAFRGPLAYLTRTFYVGVLAIAFAVGVAFLPRWLVTNEADRGLIDTVLSSIVLVSALIVPLFANRRHIEPRHFAGLPVPARRVATGLLLSSIVSWPALWLLVWFGALIVLRPEWWEHGWAVALAAVLTLGFAIAASRVASAVAKLIVPPQFAGAMRAVGLLAVIALLPVVIFAVAQALGSPHSSMTSDAAGMLAWTPFGAPIMALEFVLGGDLQGAWARFAISAASIAVLVAAWYPIVARSLTSISKPLPPTVGARGVDLFDRFPSRPHGAVAARVFIYWRRDPRYRVALIAIPLAPIVMLIAFSIAGTGPIMLALLPLPVILLLLGWSVHNDVSMDSTALWLHVASGTRGLDDRSGRIAPVLVIGLPLVLIGSSLSVTLLGEWRILPAVLGMNLGVLLASAGMSSIWSVLMPYPSTRPGDSPFAQPATSGSGAGVAQTTSMLAAVLVSAPPVLIAIPAIIGLEFWWNIMALVLGAAWGLLVLAAGIFGGGWLFDRKAPELLALTQVFD